MQAKVKDAPRKVAQAKRKEILLGFDGFMVYDAKLVPHMRKVSTCHLILKSVFRTELLSQLPVQKRITWRHKGSITIGRGERKFS